MKSIESKIFEKINLDEINKKAEEFLKEEEINIEDFVGFYKEEDVKKDQEYVERMEKEFIQKSSPEYEQAKKLATILEAVIYSQVELNDWFGPNTFTIKPSRFDDIKNGVDSIAEFQESEESASYFALGIDATLSADVEKKFDRIKKEIERGELAKVKYFFPDYRNIKSELDSDSINIKPGLEVPRVIIGADFKTVKELGELWSERNNKALEKHPIQFIILKEILLQCEAFKNFAKKVNQPEIAAIYEKSQKIVQEIYDKKQPSNTEEESYDHVLDAIEMNLKSF